MPTISDQITKQSRWLVEIFKNNNYKLDYSINSIIEIDKFLCENIQNEKPTKDSKINQYNINYFTFSIGAYCGETIITSVEGSSWITDEVNLTNLLDITLMLPNKCIIWPVQKIAKRIRNGDEDGVYPYIYSVTKDFTKTNFNAEYWKLGKSRIN